MLITSVGAIVTMLRDGMDDSCVAYDENVDGVSQAFGVFLVIVIRYFKNIFLLSFFDSCFYYLRGL